MSKNPRFYSMCDTNCLWRVCVDRGEDEPPYMQSIIKYERGSVIYRVVASAVLASNPESDDEGLWWADEEHAEKAVAAASGAWKKRLR